MFIHYICDPFVRKGNGAKKIERFLRSECKFNYLCTPNLKKGLKSEGFQK